MNNVLDITGKRNNGICCIQCESRNTSPRTEKDSFEYLDGKSSVELEAKVTVHTCHDCGLEFTLADAEDDRHRAVCEYLGVMPPEEVKSVRKAYSYSRKEMAEATRIGEASIARWEAGALIQSGAYDNFLYLLRWEENMARLNERVFGEQPVQDIHQDRGWHMDVTDRLLSERAGFSLSPVA